MTLLDVAGYSLFNDGGQFLATAGKVLLGGIGFIFGSIALIILFAASIVGIAMFSITRGLRRRSVPRTIGTFFRFTGLAVATFLALLILPVVGLIFSISILKLFIVFAIMLTVGFLVGRTISKLIGLRMRRYAAYARTADNVHGRVVRIVRSL